MKRVLFFLLLISHWAQSQLQPNTVKLFIQSNNARVETTNASDLNDPLKAIINVSYTDAMGRSMQAVSYGTSPDTLDIIQGTTELDALGRLKYSYLPSQASGTSGAFYVNYSAMAKGFYNDLAPYSEVDSYDPSPISNPIKSIAPGQAFQAGSKKGVVQNYETAGAGIRKYVIQSNGTVDGTQTYSNGDLMKTTLVDEDGNTSIEYKGGRSGRLLLVQQKDRNSSTFLTTAYVYDFIGRLCYVVPPKAYNTQNTFTETGSYFDEGIYATHYDARGRAVESHVPGGGWSYSVYNELDQRVLSQDARQRESNLWVWVKYDGHGRTLMSGTYTNAASRITLQNDFLAFTANEQFEEPSTGSGSLFNYTNKSFPSSITLTATNVNNVIYYDDYNWVSSTPLAGPLSYQTYKSSQWTNTKGMTTGGLVKNLGNGQMLKSVIYYDDRGRPIQTHTENRFGGINQTDAVLNFAGDLLEERSIYRKPNTDTLQIRKYYAYDHVGRLIQSYHQVNNAEPVAIAGYEYDGIGRMVVKKLNAGGETSIVRSAAIPDQTYDLSGKSISLLPGTYTATNGVYLAKISAEYIQKVDYAYNILGQLKSINNGSLNTAEHDLFALDLDYFETAQTYNGKLNKQTWESRGSSGAETRSFTYGYDGYDRLSSAAYTGQGSENYSLPTVSYDPNGNINNLQRNGLTASSTWGSIDNLTYSYTASTVGNKLVGITEAASTSLGHKDNGSSVDYTYYNDGSLKSDANKGITLIEYNYLGMPDKIHFGATNRIENVYDAGGGKLSQHLISGSVTIKTDYIGDLIYTNDTLKTIFHDEGIALYNKDTSIITWSNTLGNTYVDTTVFDAPSYQFFITDHLGNNRLILQRINDSTAVIQETHYGAWGEVLLGIGIEGEWDFLFQGKEWVDGYGYDFHTRGYDPYTGRFMQIDGANQFASGYTGMGNNPVSMIDPDGQVAFVPILIGAAIFGGINLGGQAIKGNVNNFKQGLGAFGMGAVSGALAVATGGSSLTYGQLALQAAVSQIPGVNVDLGGGFSFNISPSLMMGTQGFSLGANVGVGYSNGNFSAGISGGAAFGKSNITGVKGWNGRLGGGIAFDNGKFYGSLSTMQYYSGETSQRTGTIGLGGGGFKVHYENDYHVAGLTDKLHISDAGDRYRSAALQASYGDFSVGFNLFTGDPGPPNNRPSSEINGHMTYDGGNGKYSPDKYRLGGLYAGYKGIKFGRNSEQIRHVIQNRFAHDIMTGGSSKWFNILNTSPSWYGNVGSQNPFSLW